MITEGMVCRRHPNYKKKTFNKFKTIIIVFKQNYHFYQKSTNDCDCILSILGTCTDFVTYIYLIQIDNAA